MPGSSDQSPKLLDQVRQTCRRRQYSYHTEKAYVRWTERFVRFHDTTHPHHLHEDDIRAFLNHLASDRNVAASTQNQALNALISPHGEMLEMPDYSRQKRLLRRYNDQAVALGMIEADCASRTIDSDGSASPCQKCEEDSYSGTV